MKNIVRGMVVVALVGFFGSNNHLQADDGFYVRAMSCATDGTFDPGEGYVYPNTIGFKTHAGDTQEKSKKRKLEQDRASSLSSVEKQSANSKKRGKLATWMQKQK